MQWLIAVCASTLIAVGMSRAADWPNWRGPHHDGISRETGLLKSWPGDGPKVLWTVALTGGYSSVVVADGRLFTQTKDKKEDIVICFDASTGKKLWEYRFDCNYADFPSLDKRFLTGPKATPTVDTNRVYAMGNTGLLQCLDARDGALQAPEDWALLPTTVERGASVGSGAVILGGITIGERAIVGAGAVVTRDVPADAVVAGSPARPLR